jgi:glycine hydroxymethyltransferase
MEKACDEAHITLNKNAVVGDSSAMNPGGVRIGELLWPADLPAGF